MIGEIRYSIFDGQPALSSCSVWKPDNLVSIADPAEFQDYLNRLFVSQKSFGKSTYAWAEQVHGNRVLIAMDSGTYETCDGLITTHPWLRLIIRTADCAAVMCYHPEKKIIANLHVGWRGAYQQIIQQTMQILSKKWNIHPAELLVAVSPFIQSCCYEVGKDFFNYFPSRLLSQRDGKLYFDLHRCIREQLGEAGIQPNQLEISTVCTYCSSLRLPSYRRNKTLNRLINMVELRGEKNEKE